MHEGHRSWIDGMKPYLEKASLAAFFLGVSSGFPYAMIAAKGDIYYGLWYPVVVTTIAIISMILFLPETRGKDLDY